MTYRSILVHVARSDAHDAAIRAAASLAATHDALLIGLAAGLPPVVPVADGMSAAVVAEVMEEERNQLVAALADSETRFRRIVGQTARIEWRSLEGGVADTLAAESRAADLIVLPHPSDTAPADILLPADPGDVLMVAGRPVLLPAAGATTLNPRNVLIAWKDAAETRRAAADALPLLKRADTVVVLGVDDTEDGVERIRPVVEDAAAHLKRHGVTATVRVSAEAPAGAAEEILNVAAELGSDLVVSGGYGHSRVREWAFGGVTRSLLHQAGIACLLSH